MSILKHQFQTNVSIHEYLSQYQDDPSTSKYKTFCLIDSSLDTSFTKIKSIKFDLSSKKTGFFSFDINNLNDIFRLIEMQHHSQFNVIFINKSYKFVKKFHQALLLIDKKLNYSIFDQAISIENTSYSLQHLLDADKKSFFNLAFLGQQSHLSNYSLLDSITDCNTLTHRLAELKTNTSGYVSTIRNTEAATVCLSVLKSSELLNNKGNISSSGLFVEDLSQIAYNLGNSAKCKLFNIQLDNTSSITKQCEIALQMLWYHLDGIDKICDTLPPEMDKFQEYSVEECLGKINLKFFKSQLSGKWWMEIPFELKEEFEKHKYYPCVYQDYLAASSGDLPDELIETIERYEIARVE